MAVVVEPLHLPFDEVLVGGVVLEELVVGADFDDLAVLEYDDSVAVDDGAESVGDDDDGDVAVVGGELVDLLLDEVLALAVEGAGGFVEDEDLGLLDQGPGDGDPLLLPSGERDSLLAHVGLQPMGEELLVVDEGPRSRRLAGPDEVFVGVGFHAVGDVALERAGEERGLLRHESDLRPEAVQVEVPVVDPVEEDVSRGGVVEPLQQLDDGGLAAPASEDSGYGDTSCPRRPGTLPAGSAGSRS